MAKLALFLGIICLTLPARAEQAAAEPAAEPAAQAGDSAASSAVQAVVDDLASQVGRLIGDLPRPRMDLVVVLDGDLPRRAGSAGLTQVLRTTLLGSLSRNQPLRSARAASGEGWEASDAARASAARRGFELLVWLRISIENNHLTIEGTLFETEQNLWREAVAPERQVLGRLFNRTRVNAEIRRYLPPLPTPALTIRTVPLDRHLYLALAVADLDGDDRSELVLLGQRTLEIRRLTGDTGAVIAQMRLLGVPRSTTRSRSPVGSLAVGPRGADGCRDIALRTSEHSRGMIVRFDGSELRLQGTVSDFPIRWDEELECTTLAPGRSSFETGITTCGSLGATPTVAPYSAEARQQVAQPEGPPATARATLLADGSLALRWNSAVVARVSPYGTALAMSDINDDGELEILLSSDRDPGTGDQLTLLRLGSEGLIGARQPVGDVGGSVWVAAAGDADDDGLRELLAISHSTVGAQLLIIE